MQHKSKLKLIESEMSLLTAAKETALKEMNTSIKHAHEQLEQRKNVLKGQILYQYNAQLTTLLDKQNQIKEAIKLTNNKNAQSRNITKTDDINKLKPICESLKEINENNQSMLSELDLGESYLAFDTKKGFDTLKECLNMLGEIHFKGFLPSKMRLQNIAAKAACKSVLTVEVYNHHGDKLAISPDSFCLQVTDPTETQIHTELNTTGLDCTFTFTPQMSGLHKVAGFFLGQEIMSEQTHISVSSNNPVLKFGEEGNGNGTFDFPRSIAIDNDDCLYVADLGNRMIQKFSATGEFLGQFFVNSHKEDCTTLDVALDLNNGLIYCADIVYTNDGYYPGRNMLVFNLDGELQDKHNLSGVPFPIYIATNSHGDIFISDIRKLCLFKVDKEGNILCHMGDFRYPGHIAIADDDSVIVSDHKSDCIFILNPDGSIRHKFGSSGTGKGQLNKPWGVATDGEYILVADGGNNRIQVFKCDGSFVSMIESQDDPLKTPRGLVVTKDGYVYVADCNNHCIKKYKYRDEMWNY